MNYEVLVLDLDGTLNQLLKKRLQNQQRSAA